MELSKLAAPKGARKPRKRKGLGEGSGNGKTAGRGGKGQTARTGGGVRPGFEGGQMPLYRRVPKLGFRSRGKTQGYTSYAVINLADLEKFDAGTTIDFKALKSKGLVKDAHQQKGVKVLGTGDLSKKLTLKVQAISASAKEKVEKLGGSVEIVIL